MRRAARSPLSSSLQQINGEGVSYRAIAAELGVTKTSVARWASGEKAPAGDRVPEIEAAIGRLRASNTTQPPRPATPPRLRLVAPTPAPTDAIPKDDEPPTHNDEDSTMQLSREYLTAEELSFFKLAADPFDEGDSPDDIWMPAHIKAVETALFTAIRRREVVALVGGPGAGKSTMLRRLWLRGQKEKRVRLIAPATLDRRQITAGSLATAILRDLTGQDVSNLNAEKRSELLASTLADQARDGSFATLIIDEAHLMSTSALLAIKHLWDSHTLFRQLAVILVGQLPLRDRLKRDPAVRELTGRTRILELPALGDTTRDYLAWRFARVGANVDQTFEPRAIAAIAMRGENPLWIANLCVAAMRYAHEAGDPRVLPEHVGRV